jgi:hypothetical protein
MAARCRDACAPSLWGAGSPGTAQCTGGEQGNRGARLHRLKTTTTRGTSAPPHTRAHTPRRKTVVSPTQRPRAVASPPQSPPAPTDPNGPCLARHPHHFTPKLQRRHGDVSATNPASRGGSRRAFMPRLACMTACSPTCVQGTTPHSWLRLRAGKLSVRGRCNAERGRGRYRGPEGQQPRRAVCEPVPGMRVRPGFAVRTCAHMWLHVSCLQRGGVVGPCLPPGGVGATVGDGLCCLPGSVCATNRWWAQGRLPARPPCPQLVGFHRACHAVCVGPRVWLPILVGLPSWWALRWAVGLVLAPRFQSP